MARTQCGPRPTASPPAVVHWAGDRTADLAVFSRVRLVRFSPAWFAAVAFPLVSKDPGDLSVQGDTGLCGPVQGSRAERRQNHTQCPSATRQADSGCRGKEDSRFGLELLFDILGRCALDRTRTWAGRSRRRWSGTRSCSASTSPPSASWPPRLSPYLRADGARIWSLMQLERQLWPAAYGWRRGGYLDRRRTRQ